MEQTEEVFSQLAKSTQRRQVKGAGGQRGRERSRWKCEWEGAATWSSGICDCTIEACLMWHRERQTQREREGRQSVFRESHVCHSQSPLCIKCLDVCIGSNSKWWGGISPAFSCASATTRSQRFPPELGTSACRRQWRAGTTWVHTCTRTCTHTVKCSGWQTSQWCDLPASPGDHERHLHHQWQLGDWQAGSLHSCRDSAEVPTTQRDPLSPGRVHNRCGAAVWRCARLCEQQTAETQSLFYCFFHILWLLTRHSSTADLSTTRPTGLLWIQCACACADGDAHRWAHGWAHRHTCCHHTTGWALTHVLTLGFIFKLAGGKRCHIMLLL